MKFELTVNHQYFLKIVMTELEYMMWPPLLFSLVDC